MELPAAQEGVGEVGDVYRNPKLCGGLSHVAPSYVEVH